MGELIPGLLDAGLRPTVMLESSGTLLHGLRRMGADDLRDALRAITVDGRYLGAVEGLRCAWGHPVAPSRPVQDYALHVRAWQQHLAALFALEALGRVRRFSASRLALPNHPDVADAFVRTLVQAGYRWVLVQKHPVEQSDGQGPRDPHLPHVLSCSKSGGESASVLALVKTRGSDTKLVAQVQRERRTDDERVPAQVPRGGPGELGSDTPMLNGTEYPERAFASGVREHELPVIVLAVAAIRSWPEAGELRAPDGPRPRPSQRSTCSGRPARGSAGARGGW